MKNETKESINYAIPIIVVISLFFCTFTYISYKLGEDTIKLNNEIKTHIVVSYPFVKVIGVESDFISGAEGWYYVSALIEHNTLGEQWIYDFRYDSNTNVLYYDNDIDGIGVIN